MKEEDALKLLEAAASPQPDVVLEALVQASGADRGFLVLREEDALQVHTARGMGRDEVLCAHEKVSRTLLERAIAQGRALVASDAEISGIESLHDQRVRSVCVLPLRSCDGAVYLDHRSEKGLFRRADLLERFAALLDLALRGRRGWQGLVGTSKPMRDLVAILERVAQAPYPVLLQGESGTGKELVARAIHRRGPRARGPFVAANCAAIPENLANAELFGHAKGAFTGADRDRPGLFEQANGGVLFLDEVACLSAAAQESLLRVVETGESRRVGGTGTQKVDARLVAATNENLEIAEGFRKDLFYRLNVLTVDLPPLRERLEDLPLLAEHFLDRVARETAQPRKRLSKEALAALLEHRWPGNIRQMENAIRRAAALTDREKLDAADFEFLKAHDGPLPDGIVSLEEYTRRVLERWSGKMDLKEIATRLGVSRKTLWEKKKKWGL